MEAMEQSNIEPGELMDTANTISECQMEADTSNDNLENGGDILFFEDVKPQTNGNECTDNDNTDAKSAPADADADCLVRLVFRDSSIFDECHTLIGKCVRDALFEMKKAINVIVNKAENSINVYEISANENDENQFMVDTLPTECTNETEIPDYNSGECGLLDNVIEDAKDADGDENAKQKSGGGGAGNCWNCGGDHTIKDCKEKRDQAAINARKQMFAQKTKVERYHLEAEQKYSHLVPGRISSSLREALGLRRHELPLYIYKMRLYGYPEGWLEEAKINHSGLTMIHSEKRTSTDIDNDDGEVDKATYDASKFIEYPGFNAAIPSNFFDEGDYYRVPPMQFCNSKQGLTELLQENLANPYKRRKRIKLDDSEQKSGTPSQDDDDMELQNSDDDDNEPTKRPVLFASSKSDLDESNSNILPEDASSESIQLSLLELKRKQEEILRALQDEASDSNSNSNPSPMNQDGTPDTEKEKNDTNDNNDGIEKEDAVETPSNDTIEQNEPKQTDDVAEVSALETTSTETTEVIENQSIQLENVLNTPSPSMAGQSKLAVFGTPLIKQVSPYSKLPVGEKWSVGVTDVIDFENLPDSTGTYLKLTGVLGKVRSVIKRIHDDDEHDEAS